MAFLGRIPGTDRFSDIVRHPTNEPTPGILAFRVQSSLLYFNVEHVLEGVRQHIKTESGLRRVICDLSNVPHADLAAARMLRRLYDELLALREARPFRASLDRCRGGRRVDIYFIDPEPAEHTLRVIAGPHVGRLSPDARQAFYESAFVVSPDSNRMGYRLAGPHLETSGDDMLSFGLVAGAVQVPVGGHPILLMADHQTAGGYPVVAALISASMPVAAQLAPGDEVRFAETSIDAALEMRQAQRAWLESLRI